MKKFCTLILAAATLALSAAPAQAQLLMDQTLNATIGAGAQLNAAGRGSAQPPQMVIERLKRQGYTNIRMSAGSAREAMADTPAGFPVKLQFDPTTGQILSAVPQTPGQLSAQ